MHDNYDLRQEQMNKSSLVSSRKFLGTLLDIFTTHVVSALHFSSVSPFLCNYAPKGLYMRMLWISANCHSVKLLPCPTSIPYFPFYSSLSSFLGVDSLSLAIKESIAGWLWAFLMVAIRAHALSSIRLCMNFYHNCEHWILSTINSSSNFSTLKTFPQCSCLDKAFILSEMVAF